MLINYQFENFNSFREKASFSMQAPLTKVKSRFPDNYVHLSNGFDVMKTAVIVGENAGGKTNFVTSLMFFKYLFKTNDIVKSHKQFLNSNNTNSRCPQNDETTQRFYIELSDERDIIYSYDLCLDYFGIISEQLSVRKKRNVSSRLVFSVKREDMKIKCDSEKCSESKCKIDEVNSGYTISSPDDNLSAWGQEIFENPSSSNSVGLFVTKLAILGCIPAMRFSELIIKDLSPVINGSEYNLYKTVLDEQEDINILRDPRFFEIFRLIDYSIVRVEISEENPFGKSVVYRRGKDGKEFPREIRKDSKGVGEFFAWAVQLFRVIYENKIVIADEMDRLLNPVLSDRVISLINGTDHKGQFIFTTHNALNLDLKKYMKEQIYFITKDIESLESEMYSLSEFPEVRYETSKVYEIYMKGVLGGTASE